MCGIAGIVKGNGPTTPEDVAAVERIMDAQVHRGPDDSGLYRDQQVILGHRRLAIIDLSPTGRQPMSNEDGTVWITYNGEIYNYRELRDALVARGHLFKSRSDTEVIVHGYEEWGIEGLLQQLRGMFAFALYDLRSYRADGFDDSDGSRIILARDRLGIKPLYYWASASLEYVAFASEVKALLRSGLVANEPDREALIGFLLFGSVPSPLTTVKGLRCLLPGHYLVVEHSGIRLRRYWDVEYASGDEHLRNGETITADLHATLEDTVVRHLVSDVPLGIFLSGGMDSAALAALASRAGRSTVRTLTVVFEEKEFSEAQQSRLMAERFGTEHREVLVTSADFMRELPSIFAAMDQPTNDGVNTYFVSKAARESGLTVVLSGLGGDEVFWGYRHYRWLAGRNNLVRWLCQLPISIRKVMVNAASAYGRMRGQERLMRLTYLGSQVGGEGLYSAIRGFFAPEQVADLIGLDRAELQESLEKSYASIRPRVASGAPSASAFNYLEIKRYLHDQLLRDADAFSMAHSLEVRVPYLDHTIVEYAANISPALKLDHGVSKPLLVRAVGDASLIEAGRRKKQGFSLPFDQWMKQHAGTLEDIALAADGLDRRAVGRLWGAFRDGRLHWSRAWALVVLGAQG